MIIREMDLFDGAGDEGEDEIAAIMEGESYKAGDLIIQEGDPADTFYVLRTGALKVKVAGATRTTHVAIRPGEAVGWSSLAGRDLYTASVECAEPSRVWKINKDRLDQILRRHSAFGLLFYKRLAGLIGERLIRCYQELVELKEDRG